MIRTNLSAPEFSINLTTQIGLQHAAETALARHGRRGARSSVNAHALRTKTRPCENSYRNFVILLFLRANA